MKLDEIRKHQDKITSFLESHNIYPFSVTLTFSIVSSGLCSITFINDNELKDFLDLIEYSIQCDKSSYTIIKESNTVLLEGIALIKLYSLK